MTFTSKEERQPMPMRPRQLQATHDKEADEAVVSDNGGVAPVEVEVKEETTTTTTTTVPAVVIVEEDETDVNAAADIHEQTPHEQEVPTVEQPQSEEEYLASFPQEPETPRAATTFALFSDPNRFSPQAIKDATHYLTDQLHGTLWLDVNGDGKRGSDTGDASLNAKEYDTGIGGVKVQLVDCATDELVHSKTSMPNRAPGVTSLVNISQVPEAGGYDFPLDSVEAGRYYVMYQAPKDYRISGNVLPLKREVTEDGAFNCIPRGGEGSGYLEEIRENGDLDSGGYCARTIGCLEVGQKWQLKDEFENLDNLKSDQEKEYDNASQTLVALPSKSMLNVGLEPAEWELSTYQFADAKITLSFSKSVSGEDLESAVPSDFGQSAVKASLQKALEDYFGEGNDTFDIRGVDVLGGEIVESPASRRRRGLRGLQGKEEEADTEEVQVTYTLTSRGSYKPPPYEQLGEIIQESINSDPQGLKKSLKDRVGAGLPSVFEEVESAKARHLTVQIAKNQKPQGPGSLQEAMNEVNAPQEGKMASWATIPIILLAVLIASLTGTLLFRRVFVRRTKKVKKNHLDGYLNRGSGFAVSKYSPEDDNDAKARRRNSGKGAMPNGDAGGVELPGQSASTQSGSEDDDNLRHDRSERRRRRREGRMSRGANGSSGNTSSSTRSVANRSISTIGSHGSRGARGTISGGRSVASRSVSTNGSANSRVSQGSRGNNTQGAGPRQGSQRSNANTVHSAPPDFDLSEQGRGSSGRRKKKKNRHTHHGGRPTEANSMVEQSSSRQVKSERRIRSMVPDDFD